MDGNTAFACVALFGPTAFALPTIVRLWAKSNQEWKSTTNTIATLRTTPPNGGPGIPAPSNDQLARAYAAFAARQHAEQTRSIKQAPNVVRIDRGRRSA